MKNYIFLILACVTLPCGCASTEKALQMPTRSAAEVNQERMERLKTVIAEYNRDYGEFPKSLKDLSWTLGGEEFSDAWGNEFGYTVNREKIVRIWCLGADNQLGGTGENADTFLTFSPFDVTISAAEQASTPKKKWF